MGYLAEILAQLRELRTDYGNGTAPPPWDTQTAAEWLLASPSCFAVQRESMIEALRRRITWLTEFAGEEAIHLSLDAMARVPREQFVLPLIEEFAYLPTSLDIGFGQTISHPEMALVIAASISPRRRRVLDVGTGCGYLAAVLALNADHVTSIEIVPELAEEARLRLRRLGAGNVEILVGDASNPDMFGPDQFDAIAVSAGSDDVPANLLASLRDYGRLVMPLGPSQDEETLTLIEKLPDGLVRRIPLCPARFVPLTGPMQRTKKQKRTALRRANRKGRAADNRLFGRPG